MAHWTPRSNAKKLSLAPNQVYYALHHQLTLQKHRSGRKSGIDTPRRSGLVQYVISDARTRRLRYIDVASELEWDVLESVMPRPLAKEGKRILLNISAIYEYFSKLCPESRSEKAPYLWRKAPSSIGLGLWTPQLDPRAAEFGIMDWWHMNNSCETYKGLCYTKSWRRIPSWLCWNKGSSQNWMNVRLGQRSLFVLGESMGNWPYLHTKNNDFSDFFRERSTKIPFASEYFP